MARLYDTGGRILWSSREPGVSGTLANASLNGADLSRLRLSDVAIEGQLLSYLKLDGAVFSNVRFHKVDLHSASLVDVRFIDCQLNDVNLQRADMTRSVMTTPADRVAIERSIFHGTELSLADLSGLHIRDTTMHHADLSGTDFSRTLLERCDLAEAEMYQVETTDETGESVRVATNLAGTRLNRVNLDGIWAYAPTLDGIDVIDVSLCGATILGTDFPLPGQGSVGRRGEIECAIIGAVVGPWPIGATSDAFDRETARAAERSMRAMRRGVSALLRSSSPEIASSIASVGREVLDRYAIEAGESLRHNRMPPSPRRYAEELIAPNRRVVGCDLSEDAIDSLEHLRERVAGSGHTASVLGVPANRRCVPPPSLGL